MSERGCMQAIVFDFDGVIADSEGAHEAALLKTVARVGLSFTPEQYREELIGFDDREAYPAIARLCGRTLEPGLAAELAEAKRLLIEAMIADGEVPPLPGSLELVIEASGRDIPIAICSGALRSEIVLMLAAFGASDRFGTIVSADDVERAKPDPAGYLMAAERLGVAPSECAVIEDTPTGIAAARAAGYGRIIGVCHSLDAEQLHGADVVVPSTRELTVDRVLDAERMV